MTLQDAINEAVKEAVSDNTAILQEKFNKEKATIEERYNKKMAMLEEKSKQDFEKLQMESAKKLLQSGVSLEIVLASFTFSE